jgi:CRISPR-associated protein Cas2
MLRVVAYDICDSRRLRLVAKVCEDYGVRVEKSVFECNLSDALFSIFWEEILGIVDKNEDSLIVYPICNSCVSNILCIGKVVRFEKKECYIF